MSNFARKMDYAAEFLRGWPVDGGLELDYPIASGQTLSAGDLVKTTVSGGVVYVTKVVNADENTVKALGAGIVVRGNGDDKSCAASNKAIVIWGGYIVRTTKFDTTNITAAGVGVIAGEDAVGAGRFVAPAAATAGTPVLGTVIEYKAATASEDAQIVVVVR